MSFKFGGRIPGDAARLAQLGFAASHSHPAAWIILPTPGSAASATAFARNKVADAVSQELRLYQQATNFSQATLLKQYLSSSEFVATCQQVFATVDADKYVHVVRGCVRVFPSVVRSSSHLGFPAPPSSPPLGATPSTQLS